MFEFLITVILMLAVGTLLYLVIRTLPRIDEEHAAPVSQSIVERWITSEVPERVDKIVNKYFGKFLRKAKVALLKVDNAITKRLEKMKGGAPQEKKKKFEFQQMVEKKSEKENNASSS